MGHELHIRRFRDAGPEEITETEWLDFVRASPDFVVRDTVATTSPAGDRIEVAGTFGCWTGHPTVELVPFRWSGGAIAVPYADERVLTGAFLAADGLAATVVDDDGGTISAPEPDWQFPDPDVDAPPPAPVAADPPNFEAPPELDEVPFDFDGAPTLGDRLRRWLGR